MASAAQIWTRGTALAPACAATMNGNTQNSATNAIFAGWPMPNQRIRIGRNAILGAQKPSARSGRNAQRTARERAISRPSARPTIIARTSPAAAL